MSKLIVFVSTVLAACASTAPQSTTNHTLPSVDRMGKRLDVVGEGQDIVLRLCTDRDGKVTSAEVERGSPLGTFDKAVTNDVMAWTFEPTTAPSCRKVTVRYRSEA